MGLRRLLRGGGLWRQPRVQTSRRLPHALLGICGGATGLYLSTAAPLLAASQPDDPPEEALFSPSRPYPLWDHRWDAPLKAAAAGPCRHLLLVRHGQYDEESDADEERGLTALGRQQAELAGLRLAAMSAAARGVSISRLHVSGMRRARETADIIASKLPAEVVRTPPDPDLNEGMPALPVPGWTPERMRAAQEDGGRIEDAFRRYFHRGQHAEGGVVEEGGVADAHECEVIVGHANVLRFFVCRALQLPPEAWLRMHTFNCSLTYLIVMPDGRVQIRLLGDVGHLPEELITFSGRLGWNWCGKPTKCLPESAVVKEVKAREAG